MLKLCHNADKMQFYPFSFVVMFNSVFVIFVGRFSCGWEPLAQRAKP